ncbi:unnamed protein product [Oncorhynchus mykiss]|uniref:Sulfatase N-terminal domain-containing protein n=1 Tax=Oncorhynchus mykiss TaxID=8022 RepID=A0A060XED9_ONCMY|nr:unnamed protein product [Oncorhynchus mykiss]
MTVDKKNVLLVSSENISSHAYPQRSPWIPCCLDLLLLFDVCYALNDDKRPNFVLIMVDDLAIVDSGNTTLRTPNIDMLAQEGVRLTQHIAAAPPLYAQQGSLPDGPIPDTIRLCGENIHHHSTGVYIISAASGSLPKEEVTFAKVAKRQGYETALIGKWHRGLNCERNDDYCHHPGAHGFDHFYGITLTNLRDCQPGRGSIFTNVQAHTPFKTLGVGVATVTFLHARGVVTVWRKLVLRVVALVGAVAAIYGTTELLRKVNSALPFLLFFSFIQVHTDMFASPAFQGTSQHGIYGNAIQEVDWSVGQLMQTLDLLNLRENTLVYLTSDQLAHLEEITVRGEVHRGWNGI